MMAKKKIFALTKMFKLLYNGLVVFAGSLGLIRWLSVFTDIVVINAEINSHISNFSLSLLFYLAVGVYWIQTDEKFSLTVYLGISLIVGNLICETLLGSINTPDIIDAVYGIIGVLISFVFLFSAHKYGLVHVSDTSVD